MTGETAQSFSTPEISTDGIAIFDITDMSAVDDPLSAKSDGQVSDWTPEQAAKALGKSVRTIRRMLQEGSLAGYKTTGVRRDEWRVKPVPVSASDWDARTMTVPVSANKSNDDRLWQLLREKDAKLEALIMRAGYLEAQLVERDKDLLERDNALKLITDRKTSWIDVLKRWFTRIA